MRIITYHKSHGVFWFRVFGYGAAICDRSIHPEPFSIRNRLCAFWRIGKFTVRWLRPLGG
jgi:hypothetical protein